MNKTLDGIKEMLDIIRDDGADRQQQTMAASTIEEYASLHEEQLAELRSALQAANERVEKTEKESFTLERMLRDAGFGVDAYLKSQERCRRLEEALRPFAEIDFYPDSADDDVIVAMVSCFRAARAALRQEQG